MSLSVGHAQLQKSVRNLTARWQSVEEAWQDQVRRDFEQNYLEPVGPLVRSTLQALERLEELVGRLKQECG